MSILTFTLTILGAGAIGGLANAFFSKGGFVKPKKIRLKGGDVIWRPGWIANMIIGALAALVSCSLYGPMASADVTSSAPFVLTGSVIGGAVLLGVLGARFFKTEMDKIILKSTAITAAQAPGSEELAAKIASADTADQALEAAQVEVKKLNNAGQ